MYQIIHDFNTFKSIARYYGEKGCSFYIERPFGDSGQMMVELVSEENHVSFHMWRYCYNPSSLDDLKNQEPMRQEKFLQRTKIISLLEMQKVFFLSEDNTLAFKAMVRESGHTFRTQKDGRNTNIIRLTASEAKNNRYPIIRFCPSCFGNAIISNAVIAPVTQADENELFGKICYGCKSPLAYWQKCSLCGCVYWATDEHLCEELKQKLKENPQWLMYNTLSVSRFTKNPIQD